MKANRGLSLLEILVALAVLLIGMTSLVALFGSATLSHKKAYDLTNLSFLVDAVQDEVVKKLATLDQPLSEGLLLQGQKLAFYPQYRYDVYVLPLPNGLEGYWVIVNLFWHQEAKQQQTSWAFIILEEKLRALRGDVP